MPACLPAFCLKWQQHKHCAVLTRPSISSPKTISDYSHREHLELSLCGVPCGGLQIPDSVFIELLPQLESSPEGALRRARHHGEQPHILIAVSDFLRIVVQWSRSDSPVSRPSTGEMMQKASQIALGVILLALVGVTDAPAQSRQQAAGGPWVVQNAERGDARAQTVLGFMFATGRGVPQNFALAAYWYTRAAEQGNPDAQYQLGVSYDLGKGVAVDWILAHKWLNLSASRTRGGEERDFRARMRNAVATKLGPPSLAFAQGLAVAWRPKPER